MAGAPNDPRPKPPPITSDPKPTTPPPPPTGTTTKVPPLADNSLSPTIEGMKQADLGALSTAHGEATGKLQYNTDNLITDLKRGAARQTGNAEFGLGQRTTTRNQQVGATTRAADENLRVGNLLADDANAGQKRLAGEAYDQGKENLQAGFDDQTDLLGLDRADALLGYEQGKENLQAGFDDQTDLLGLDRADALLGYEQGKENLQAEFDDQTDLLGLDRQGLGLDRRGLGLDQADLLMNDRHATENRTAGYQDQKEMLELERLGLGRGRAAEDRAVGTRQQRGAVDDYFLGAHRGQGRRMESSQRLAEDRSIERQGINATRTTEDSFLGARGSQLDSAFARGNRQASDRLGSGQARIDLAGSRLDLAGDRLDTRESQLGSAFTRAGTQMDQRFTAAGNRFDTRGAQLGSAFERAGRQMDQRYETGEELREGTHALQGTIRQQTRDFTVTEAGTAAAEATASDRAATGRLTGQIADDLAHETGRANSDKAINQKWINANHGSAARLVKAKYNHQLAAIQSADGVFARILGM